MLPAVVVEQIPLKDAVQHIKEIKNNIPATLAGVFGIDFVGSVIKILIVPIYLIFIAISVGIGYLIVQVTPGTAVMFSGFEFSWVPIAIVIYLMFIGGGILKKMIESVKVIYFTIFYTSIMHPAEITESMKGELTGYLNMGDSVKVVNQNIHTQQTTNSADANTPTNIGSEFK